MTGLGLVFVALFASAATPAPATHFVISGTPTNTTAGDLLSLTVTAYDGADTVDTGYTGTVQFTSSDTGGETVLPSDYTFQAADNGTHTFTDETKLTTTGSQTVTASDGSIDDGTSAPITVDPAALDHFKLSDSTDPDDAIDSQKAGDPFTVYATAYDAFDNVKSDYPGEGDSQTFSGLEDSPSGTPPDYGDINWGEGTGQGSASITAFAAGSELTITDDDSGTSVTSEFTVDPGDLEHFDWTAQPGANQDAGVTFPETIQVTAYDQWDNVKTNYDPAGVVFSGLSPSPSGCDSDNETVIPGGTFPCNPVYDFSWSDGVGTSTGTTVRGYKAETTSLTVTDGSVNASSSGFTVAPAALDKFKLSDSTNPNDAIDTQTAGSPFSVYATAYDAFGNVKTNYPGGGDTQSFSGLANSPLPSNTPPSYGAITWGSNTGQGSASITAFAAGSTLTLTDTATSKTGTSTFTVLPGPLFRFRWTDQPGASQTAGVVFDSVAATAYDQWDNVKTNYNPAGAVFSGLSASLRGCASNGITVTPGGATPCQPVYGFAWLSGIATSTTAKDYKAETTQLTVTDGSITASTDSGTPDSFTVGPNEPDLIAFVQQPTLTQFNTNISPAVTVKVEDAFGNATPNKPVTMSINPAFNPPNPDGILTGGGATNTNSLGIATFAGLKIDKPAIGYKLDATVPTTYSPPSTRTATSIAFDIANQVTTCTGNCTATGSTPNSTAATVDAFGLTGGPLNSRLGPAVNAASSARLGVTVAPSVVVPSNVCGGPNTQLGLGDGFWITTFQSPSNQPSFKIVATLAKKEAQEKPGNPGATKFDICLGTFNTSPGTLSPGCASPTNSQSWKTKDGSCAVLVNGYYWGLVADYPNKVKSCPQSPGSNLFPGVLSKNKTGAGDVVITFCKPYPWDGGGGWR
jgi:hypothetical protein